MSDVLYDDRFVTVTRTAILLKHYYLPLASSKRVALQNISGVLRLPTASLRSGSKVWGKGLAPYFMSRDMRRFSAPNCDRQVGFKYVDRSGKQRRLGCGFTCEDPDRVVRLLLNHSSAMLLSDVSGPHAS
jgi:hypothetical protein